MTKLIAIDPPDCGCTGCLTGEYVPLSVATPGQVALMLSGHLRDNTGEVFHLEIRDGDVVAHAEYSGLEWQIR